MNYNYKSTFDHTLPECLNEFLNYLVTIKGKSPNTITGYRVDLIMFFRFMKIYKEMVVDNDNLVFDEIVVSDIDNDFLNTLKLGDLISFISFTENYRNNSSYARARKAASLRSFFKYLHQKAKIIKENPAKELESPKIDKRHPVYLTLEESKRLLNAIDGKNKERDYCIITLFLNCGLRLSELCSINISEIKDDTLTIIGKGNKERTIYLNRACKRAVNDYISMRLTILDKVPVEYKDALFISNKKCRISERSVERLVKKYIEKAGLDKNKYSPHKLRHTAATLMYKHGGVDIRSLQMILGHENVSTTQIYTHVDDESLRKAVNSNPLAEE